MSPCVYVTGQPVDLVAKVSGLTLAAEFPDAGVGGPVSAEFTLKLAPQDRPGWLVKDAVAEGRLGGLQLLSGKVDEVDWVDGTVTVSGAAREGGDTACLTAAGLTSSTPDPILDAAISRGALTWTRAVSVGTSPLTDGDQTRKLNSVTEMLAAVADLNHSRFYVDPYRRLLATTDPTTPAFHLQPSAGELSWVSEAQATRVLGAWHDAAGAPHVTAVGSGAVEKMVDLDPKGALDVTRATAILNSLLAASTAGGWTGGLTVAAEQIFGHPHLAAVYLAVAAGQGMFRLHGQRDPRPGRVPTGFVDFVCERIEWNTDARTVTLTPRGMVARDWTAILADQGLEAA